LYAFIQSPLDIDSNGDGVAAESRVFGAIRRHSALNKEFPFATLVHVGCLEQREV
jgi:hypothetical protein